MMRVSVKRMLLQKSYPREYVRLKRGQANQLRACVLAVLKSHRLPDCEVHVFYTDDAGMKLVNLRQRGIDRSTDVLSFPLVTLTPGEPPTPSPGIVDPSTGRIFLGDIVLSLPRAAVQAYEYGHSLSRELCYLTVHGTLHLLGYDHECHEDKTVMRAKEEMILGTLGMEKYE